MTKIRNVASRGATMGLAALLLSGCSLGETGSAVRAVEGNEVDASRFLEQARTSPLPDAAERPVRVVDDVFTGAEVHRNEHGMPLPRQWEVPGVTLIEAQPQPLYQIGTLITSRTGLPVSFSPDAFQGVAASGTGANSTKGGLGAAAGPAAPPRPSDINALLNGVNAAGNTSGSLGNEIRAVTDDQMSMTVHHTGRLSDFLTQVGSHFGVTWEYGEGRIHIFRNVTRTYSVHALPLDLTLTSSMNTSGQTGAAGASGGQSGGSSQSTTANISLKLWDDIKSAVTAIVGADGTVTVGVSTGTITVTATPEVVARVSEYMTIENKRLSKQVTVSVQVYSVALTRSDNFQLDLTGVFKKSSKYGFSFGNATGAASLATLAGTGGASAIPGVAAGILSPTSAFSGSSSLFGALSSLGRVSTITTTSVTTLNGIPAPVQVANTRGYLAQVTTTVTPSASGTLTSTSLTPGTLTTGYNLSVLPRVSDTGDSLLMSFAVNISDLAGAQNGFDTFTTPDGQNSVQLPNVNSRSFVQQAEIGSGQSLVLSGFEQNAETAGKTGSGSPDNMLLGGKQTGTRERDIIVIVMTPTIVEQAYVTEN